MGGRRSSGGDGRRVVRAPTDAVDEPRLPLGPRCKVGEGSNERATVHEIDASRGRSRPRSPLPVGIGQTTFSVKPNAATSWALSRARITTCGPPGRTTRRRLYTEPGRATGTCSTPPTEIVTLSMPAFSYTVALIHTVPLRTASLCTPGAGDTL